MELASANEYGKRSRATEPQILLVEALKAGALSILKMEILHTNALRDRVEMPPNDLLRVSADSAPAS